MLKATALAENRDGHGLLGEHGLSVYIEYGSTKLLLDAGTTELFADHAKALGIHLENVDIAVLSHAHYDHSGGFDRFFRENSKAGLWLRESCKENCYRQSSKGMKYIGIPGGFLETYRERLHFIREDTALAPGIWSIGHHMDNMAEKGQRAKMYRQEDGEWKFDDFSHEQSLVFETDQGLVIFNSCCHGGPGDIIRETGARPCFGNRPVYALVGGFHLKDIMRDPSMDGEEKRQKIHMLGRDLLDSGCARFYTGHCTGDEAFECLKEVLGDRLYYFGTGDCIEFL